MWSSMSLPANTSDTCCLPKASTMALKKSKLSKIGRNPESQRHPVFPGICQLLSSFHFRHSENTVPLTCLTRKGTLGTSPMSAVQPLKHLKRLSPQLRSLPLDSGHSNNSWNRCFRLCTCCCPFNYDINGELHPLRSTPGPFPLRNSTMTSTTKSSSRFLKPSTMVTLLGRLWTPDRRGHRSLELAILFNDQILTHQQARWSELPLWIQPHHSVPSRKTRNQTRRTH